MVTADRSEQACGAKGPYVQVGCDSDCLGSVLGWLTESLTAPQLVHQLVALPYILQMGPRQVYPGPRRVYPRRRSHCTVLPAAQKC
jgi:hypothetical protein